MSKRGLSNEEKRKRMLDFFLEKQDFFQLKDIEKLCSQEKGITIQTIKDVLQSLVDDGLVDSEKIGTSIYYWSLPSKALKKRQETIKKIDQDFKEETSKNANLKQRFESYQSEEDDEDKREKLLEEYKSLVDQRQKFLKELELYKENDPELYEKMRSNILDCKKACNRWVENIFSLKSWLKNKFRIDESVINKQFEIPEDLDYIN